MATPSASLSADLWELVFRLLSADDWAACCLVCNSWFVTIITSRFFFPHSKLLGHSRLGDADHHMRLVRRLGSGVGATLHSASLTGPSCTAGVVALLPSLRSLRLCCAQEPWGQLAALQHLSSLRLEQVGSLAGLHLLSHCSALRAVSIAVSDGPAQPWQQGLLQLAEGLPALGGITQLSLALPEFVPQLNSAIASLPLLASLSVTTARPSKAAAPINPGAWAALTQLILNLAGDSTTVTSGLALLQQLCLLSVVGAGEHSPPDLFSCGSALETLAIAGRGGLPPVPDCLDARLPHLVSLEASYGALDSGLLPAELCIPHLTSIDLYNAGMESWEGCPHALPAAFSQITSLRKLNLSKNFLGALPPAMTGLSSLTWLSLCGNKLVVLPGGPYLHNLRYLNACANRLPAVPESLGQAPNLEELGLGGNPFQEVAQADIEVLQRLGRLRLLGMSRGSGAQQLRTEVGQAQAGKGREGGRAGGRRWSDGDVALLWVMACKVPECNVLFESGRFMSRFS